MNQHATRSRTFAFGALLAAGALVAAVGCSKNDATTQTTSAPAGSSSTTAAPATTPGSTAGTSAPKGTSTTAAKGTSTTTSGSSKTTAAPSASDQAAAEASLITAADVPSGFTAGKSSTSESPNPFLGVPECAAFEKAVKASDDERTAKAKATFKNTGGDEIENSVEVYTDAKVAKDSAAVLADKDFPACIDAAFGAAMKKNLPAGTTIDNLKAARLEIDSAADLGIDAASAFTLDLTITTQGQTVNLKMGVVMLTSGRALSQLTTQGTTAIEIAPTIKAAAASLKANAPS